MAISKIIYGGDTLIDLTHDTVTAENIDEGITAHDASGTELVGLRKVFDVLPIANGGTGRSTLTSGYFLRGNGTSAVTMSSAASARDAMGLGNTTGALPIANGGTGATTANAAATNLYESGTWTPKLICEGTGAVNPTYTHSYNGTAGSPIGRYTRIGNLVYVQCYIPALISAAGTGLAAISGLPYAGSGDMDSTLVNRGHINALNGSVSTLNPVLKVSSGGTTVGYRIPDGSGGYNWKVNTSTSPKGSMIQFAGIYRIG